MKKTLIGMLAGMTIMGCIGLVGFNVINKNHTYELEEIKAGYETQINYYETKITEICESNADLEEQVYLMMEGENYKFTIHHDEETHTYEQTGEGLFRKTTHNITR